jgi:hypothetical protein
VTNLPPIRWDENASIIRRTPGSSPIFAELHQAAAFAACAGDTGRAGLVHEIKFDGYRMPACNRLRRCATFDPHREFLKANQRSVYAVRGVFQSREEALPARSSD